MNALLLKAAPYLGISLLLLIGKCGYDAKQRQIGRMQERLRIADSTLAVVRRDSVRLDTTYRVDTIRLSRTLVRRDTVLRTVDRFLRDTVPVPVEIVREIVRADSAVIQSCQIALTTCEQKAANAERRAALLAQQVADTRKLLPSAFSNNVKLVTAVGVGFALCKWLLCPKPD